MDAGTRRLVREWAALVCDRRTLHKGPNLTGIDPVTRERTERIRTRDHLGARYK
jgi:hypothetical protein